MEKLIIDLHALKQHLIAMGRPEEIGMVAEINGIIAKLVKVHDAAVDAEEAAVTIKAAA